MSLAEMSGNGFGRIQDVAEIGLLMFVERCGNGHDDAIHFRNS
jgi:hypothetical protein